MTTEEQIRELQSDMRVTRAFIADLIRAMMENHVFRATCWVSSHRGGMHVFEVRA